MGSSKNQRLARKKAKKFNRKKAKEKKLAAEKHQASLIGIWGAYVH